MKPIISGFPMEAFIPDFEPLELPAEREVLATWLSSERWEFHSNPEIEHEQVLKLVDGGDYFDGPNNASFWIMLEAERVGLIRLFDLEDIGDGEPMFDLRIRSMFRGRGLGTLAMQWLTDHLFSNFDVLERISGTTRVDNLAMRRAFRRCGYVKEAHHRRSWPSADGQIFDTVGYGILREDWASKTITPVDWADEPEGHSR
jgi:RimJ/RimL family protein N-acetyltransferase